MSIECDKCGETVDALPIHKCRSPRGHRMPDTREQFEKMGDLYESALLAKDAEIALR